ncbi:DNA transfer protein [Yersinia vastinensis]|uniref:DNA transfer protein n=1 Tax=Yersinia vastinensis TaxID=2890318 RepID=UPI0011A29DF3|nr:DNA transfer protein [Yersinia vastinensis]
MSGVFKSVGNVLGSITGANQAADAQVNAANQTNATNLQIYREQQARTEPWLQAGASALSGLTSIAGQPIDRNKLLNNYFKSSEYSQLADQARYNQLASAEATGGLGSTATSNGLTSIAPQLGQNYLGMMTDQQNNMYSQLLGLSNVGLSAAGASNAAAGNYANNYANTTGQIGSAQAGRALSNGSLVSQGLGFLGGLF